MRAFARKLIVGCSALLLFIATACQQPVTEMAPPPAPLPEGEQAVRLVIVRGPAGGLLALVPVYIDGQGPFTFALDTGASHSLVDGAVARKLELAAAGPPANITGVAAVTTAVPVRVRHWRIGDVELPARDLMTLDMPQSNGKAQLQGLLGSDILSLFGVVHIDYDGRVLILNPKAAAD